MEYILSKGNDVCVIFAWRRRRISISWTVFELAVGKIAHPYEIHLKTHWGLVMLFGDIDLGQHWFRQWLVAWRHQAITWTNVDLSSGRFCGIHLRAISWEIPQPSFTEFSLKITCLKLNWNGANELNLKVTKSHSSVQSFWNFAPAMAVFVFSIKSQTEK